MQLFLGDTVYVLVFTKENSLCSESVGKIDQMSSTVSNFAGSDQVGTSWTDKVMVVKAQSAQSTSVVKPAEEGEGADDDEWVKLTTFCLKTKDIPLQCAKDPNSEFEVDFLQTASTLPKRGSRFVGSAKIPIPIMNCLLFSG